MNACTRYVLHIENYCMHENKHALYLQWLHACIIYTTILCKNLCLHDCMHASYIHRFYARILVSMIACMHVMHVWFLMNTHIHPFQWIHACVLFTMIACMRLFLPWQSCVLLLFVRRKRLHQQTYVVKLVVEASRKNLLAVMWALL